MLEEINCVMLLPNQLWNDACTVYFPFTSHIFVGLGFVLTLDFEKNTKMFLMWVNWVYLFLFMLGWWVSVLEVELWVVVMGVFIWGGGGGGGTGLLFCVHGQGQ